MRHPLTAAVPSEMAGLAGGTSDGGAVGPVTGKQAGPKAEAPAAIAHAAGSAEQCGQFGATGHLRLGDQPADMGVHGPW
jgi:hypothetical protein